MNLNTESMVEQFARSTLDTTLDYVAITDGPSGTGRNDLARPEQVSWHLSPHALPFAPDLGVIFLALLLRFQ